MGLGQQRQIYLDAACHYHTHTQNTICQSACVYLVRGLCRQWVPNVYVYILFRLKDTSSFTCNVMLATLLYYYYYQPALTHSNGSPLHNVLCIKLYTRIYNMLKDMMRRDASSEWLHVDPAMWSGKWATECVRVLARFVHILRYSFSLSLALSVFFSIVFFGCFYFFILSSSAASAPSSSYFFVSAPSVGIISTFTHTHEQSCISDEKKMASVKKYTSIY